MLHRYLSRQDGKRNWGSDYRQTRRDKRGIDVTVVYYAKISTTDGKDYFLGYEIGNPSTGDVQVLRVPYTII